MIHVRKSEDRGHNRLDWLDSRYTFSFADYWDPEFQGFRALRVINEDRVAPGRGFGTHPHRDMEILTYVLEGALEHRDSMGNGAVIRPLELQRMTAGTGVTHSEVNPSPVEPVHLLQIWILPERRGLKPGYEQKRFAPADLAGKFRLLAGPQGDNGSLLIHQDVNVYGVRLAAGEQAALPLAAGRNAWLQLARGSARVNGTPIAAGDGVAFSEEKKVELVAEDAAEALLFDLA